MENIYTKHDAAFKQVSAFLLMQNGEAIGKVAIKYPKDGVGRLTAYVHFYGSQMEYGTARGYGYDKTGAAIGEAVKKLIKADGRYITEYLKDYKYNEAARWAELFRACGIQVYCVI